MEEERRDYGDFYLILKKDEAWVYKKDGQRGFKLSAYGVDRYIDA